MNRERLVASIRSLRHFVNNSLGLDRGHSISGFELNESLLDAAAYNTYIETISNKADTLYLRAKESITEMTTYSYLDCIRRLSDRFCWTQKSVLLAFDYTDENFYGDVQGIAIHGWDGQDGITGKFKFLTCSILSDEVPEKIPLLSVPIMLGHYKSHTIRYMLDLIKPLVGNIELILFDRGFYDSNLMYDLNVQSYPYLIFVPKQKDKQEMILNLEKGDHVAISHEFEIRKDRTVYHDENFLVFLKQIYCKSTDESYDWVFATNVQDVALGNIIITYKKRWRIETGFRVQDDAQIKCKSKEMKVRYFLFCYQQMLQTQWVCFSKKDGSFKEFLVSMHEVCKDLVAHPKSTYRNDPKAKSLQD